jgi:hypothetical protein
MPLALFGLARRCDESCGYDAGMSRLRVPAVDDPDFLVDVTHGEVSELRLVGSADGAATVPLGALLETVHRELIVRLAGRTRREVIVDLQALEAMAAPCFMQLMRWLARVQGLARAERYTLRFRVNPAISWQEHSLRSLACFDTDLVRLDS